METLLDRRIGEIVSEDFRTAAVFSKSNVDFCCGGQKTVKEVCESKRIDSDKLQSELIEVLESRTDQQIDFKSWPLDLLADYIEKVHHRYISEKAPLLMTYLYKICSVHGDRHMELIEVNRLFERSAEELRDHMQKEEAILFPYIRSMVEARRNDASMFRQPFGSVANPVRMMMDEHDVEGERFRAISKLTNNYTPPEDACETYRVAFRMLEEFEKDLHKHIHLENNILFPGALELEKN